MPRRKPPARKPDLPRPKVYDGPITVLARYGGFHASVPPLAPTGHAADGWAYGVRECPLEAVHAAVCNALFWMSHAA